MSSDRKTWKTQLLSAKKLYANWHKMLHKLTGAIAEFWDDAEFRAECSLRDDGQVADWIEVEFPQLPLHWLDLLAVYRAYPQPQQWVDAKPQDLLDALRQEAETEHEPRPRVSWKAIAAELREENARLRDRIIEIENENRELRKLVSHEPVAV